MKRDQKSGSPMPHAAGERGSSVIGHRSTGPRTPAGKRRSRYNALKSGIFAKAVLLKDESPAEYGALVKGLWEDLRPQGTLEAALVENLAVLLWRKRRCLRAEGAEIANATEFKIFDFLQAQMVEAWNHSRAGETSGGMLRHASNRFVLREVLSALTIYRHKLEHYGLRKGEDTWLLTKLCGLDHDTCAPLSSLLRMYQVCSEASADAP